VFVPSLSRQRSMIMFHSNTQKRKPVCFPSICRCERYCDWSAWVPSPSEAAAGDAARILRSCCPHGRADWESARSIGRDRCGNDVLFGVCLNVCPEPVLANRWFRITHTQKERTFFFSAGLRDSTAVLFFTDHGWSLGENGEWAKHTNFELDVHAPWYVPNTPPDKTIAAVFLFCFVAMPYS
jgi:hypothetical protein